MSFIGSLVRDLRHSLRLFARSPGFVAIAVLSIGFGTGANVAIFSATDALLLRPLPVDRPDELMTIGTLVPRGMETFSVVSYPDFVDIRARSRSFAGLAAFASRAIAYAPAPDAIPRAQVATFVNADFFRTLDVVPVLGRDFGPQEDARPARDRVVMLSHGLWLRDFAGDAQVIGRRVRLSGIDFTVVGVLPEEFTGLEPRYVRDTAYVPLSMLSVMVEPEVGDPLEQRDTRLLYVKGRLNPGIRITAAQAELRAISRDLERAYPKTNEHASYILQTELQVRFQQEPFDVGLVLALSVLSIAVLCVACANVAGLLASRAVARGREIALRLAIGAGRGRIVRQLLVESLLIALAGGMLGVLVGYAGIGLLRQVHMPTDVFAYPEFRLDQRALTFSLIAAVASAFLFGLVPAIQTARVDLLAGLKSTETGFGRRRLTARSVLVAAQVALSLVLLTIALSVFETFRQQLGQGSGFRVERSAKVTIDAGHRRSGPEIARFYEQAATAARGLPGVTSVTVTSAMPLFSHQPGTFVPEGYELARGETAIKTFFNCVDEGYFTTMEIPIVRGRTFLATDSAVAPKVAIVNEVVAGRFWPGSSAVGQRFRLNDGTGPLVEVVGVAKTAKYHYFLEPPQEMIYLPFRQQPRAQMVLLAATSASSASLLRPLSHAIARIDADAPLSDVQTIETFYAARTTMFSVLGMRLIGAMGIMGVILTIVGLYGLVSYAASRRTREIGIRIAVGATAARVIRLILSHGLQPTSVGLVAGLAMSAGAVRLLQQLIQVERFYDLRAFLLAVPGLLAISLLAAFVPARRSARVDPTVALRSE
jgi:predicted permease